MSRQVFCRKLVFGVRRIYFAPSKPNQTFTALWDLATGQAVSNCFNTIDSPPWNIWLRQLQPHTAPHTWTSWGNIFKPIVTEAASTCCLVLYTCFCGSDQNTWGQSHRGSFPRLFKMHLRNVWRRRKSLYRSLASQICGGDVGII